MYHFLKYVLKNTDFTGVMIPFSPAPAKGSWGQVNLRNELNSIIYCTTLQNLYCVLLAAKSDYGGIRIISQTYFTLEPCFSGDMCSMEHTFWARLSKSIFLCLIPLKMIFKLKKWHKWPEHCLEMLMFTNKTMFNPHWVSF